MGGKKKAKQEQEEVSIVYEIDESQKDRINSELSEDELMDLEKEKIKLRHLADYELELKLKNMEILEKKEMEKLVSQATISASSALEALLSDITNKNLNDFLYVTDFFERGLELYKEYLIEKTTISEMNLPIQEKLEKYKQMNKFYGNILDFLNKGFDLIDMIQKNKNFEEAIYNDRRLKERLEFVFKKSYELCLRILEDPRIRIDEKDSLYGKDGLEVAEDYRTEFTNYFNDIILKPIKEEISSKEDENKKDEAKKDYEVPIHF